MDTRPTPLRVRLDLVTGPGLIGLVRADDSDLVRTYPSTLHISLPALNSPSIPASHPVPTLYFLLGTLSPVSYQAMVQKKPRACSRWARRARAGSAPSCPACTSAGPVPLRLGHSTNGLGQSPSGLDPTIPGSGARTAWSCATAMEKHLRRYDAPVGVMALQRSGLPQSLDQSQRCFLAQVIFVGIKQPE